MREHTSRVNPFSGRRYLEIGQVPPEEQALVFGTPNYQTNARKQCFAYIEALLKKLGKEPDGAELAIKHLPHDVKQGTTFPQVVCYYDENKPASLEYAKACETKGPKTWADAGVPAPIIVFPMQGLARGA